jgi:hypothetical protein
VIVALVFRAGAGAKGVEEVGDAKSSRFQSVLVFVGLVVGWVGPLLVGLGAEGVNEVVVDRSQSVSVVFATLEGFDPPPKSPHPHSCSSTAFSFLALRPPNPPKLSNPTHTSLLRPPATFELLPAFICCCFSKANLAASVMFFAPSAPVVDPAKRSLNASPAPPPLVEAAEPERWTPKVEGVDLPEPVACRGVDDPPAVDDEEESRAKRSGLPYVGFGFGGGVEVDVVVVGREVEARVGGFEGVVVAQRSAKESLIVTRDLWKLSYLMHIW